jgi:hypothetical protein
LAESGQAVDMEGEQGPDGSGASEAGRAAAGGPQAQRLSRRQAIGRLSAVAAAGAVAWVTPEILTAKPASGAVLSGTTEPASLSGAPLAAPSKSSASGPGTGGLAFTGLDLERDAEVGVALLAGGWAMHHWASRPLRLEAQQAAAATEPGAAPSAPAE